MPPESPVGHTVEVIDVACDESGSEGERLVGGNTAVFAHAGVCVDRGIADEAVRELRERIRSPAEEYKANHLLRQKHRAVLVWLLGSSGPLSGHAHVYLVDKAAYLVRLLVEALVPGQGDAAALSRRGASFDQSSWRAFLDASNALLWLRATDDAAPTDHPVDAFVRAVEELRARTGERERNAVLGDLVAARAGAVAYRAGGVPDPSDPPLLDPLFPAVARAFDRWSAGGRRVSIVHDDTRTLRPERVGRLQARLGTTGRLAGLRLVDSRDDARVQLADFLAGVARKIAENALDGRGDPELTALLRPYVDTESVWVDAHSGSSLLPADCLGSVEGGD